MEREETGTALVATGKEVYRKNGGNRLFFLKGASLGALSWLS